MARIVLIFSLLVFSSNLFPQSDFSKSPSLTDSKIVLLGEQTHGDGAVFDKKVALIKQLHKTLGFNSIAFESGMYDNYKAFQLYREGKEDIAIFRESVFPIWSETKAFAELCAFISKNPEIRILGFDNQEGSLFKEYYINDLKAVLNTNGHELTQEEATMIEKTLVYLDIGPYVKSKQDSLALFKLFENISGQLSKIKNGNFHTKIIAQTFKSSVSNFSYILKSGQKEKIHIQNPRDKQMAENLIFLQEQFPEDKIVAWGASYHFANRINEFEYTQTTEDYATKLHAQTKELTEHNETSLAVEIQQIKELQHANTMGRILKAHYGDLLYSMGFVSYKGSYLGVHDKEFPILTPPETSLEAILYDEKSDALLIEPKDFPKDKYYTSALGYLPLFANWEDIFDGIYYIPTMYPPKRISYDTPDKTLILKNNTKITGQVFDSENSRPIPNADIYYAANNKSVIGNLQGSFSIAKNKNQEEYLVFSALGYESDSVQLKNIGAPLQIGLKKTANLISLTEVVVSNKKPLSAKEILKKARQKIGDNYTKTPFNQQFFFRVQGYRKDSLFVNEEALLNTFFKKGNTGMNTPEKYIFGEIQQLRNTTETKIKSYRYGVGSLWTTLIRDIILSKTNVLYHTSAYQLTKEGLVSYHGQQVYKISFANTSPGAFSTGYGYPAPEASSGFIFLDSNSFAVLYYEHCVRRQLVEPKRSEFKTQTFHKIVQSYKKVGGSYFINLFNVTDKTNRYSKKDNSYAGASYSLRTLMSTDIETEKVTVFNLPIQKLKQNLKIESDPEFWENNDFYLKDDVFQIDSCE